jgi:hypothetical protein
LILGMRHATDADHVIAVTTIVSNERRRGAHRDRTGPRSFGDGVPRRRSDHPVQAHDTGAIHSVLAGVSVFADGGLPRLSNIT